MKISMNEINGYSNNYDESKAKAFQKKAMLNGIGEKFKTVLKMLTDKSYNLKDSTKVALAGAIAYSVMPIDLIPDYIIGLGYIDDAIVLKLVLDKAKEEIERYKSLKINS